ncbi:MAG TPA: alpha-amylase family glycosyl hydrolase [Thermotogota bacterium]|nr:alpha-amylase family glycosyl hydrolase [Thermotogota bacterium]HRW34484.1 alpha-amylase family glycosyl hydrolase [Thermotogota bacterium]
MSEKKWYEQTTFYHIYPLGFCGDRIGKMKSPIKKITQYLEYIHHLGFTGIYLGPLFESISHGYDTTDYFKVDGRLGDNNDLRELIRKAHDLGIRVILDGVFNHVGRNFFAFQDILQKRENSQYLDWFSALDFQSDNRHHDGFSYHTWESHEELVQLNLRSESVKGYLFEAIRSWVRDFDIDGLRLDAADCLDLEFLKHLRYHTRTLKEDFWLMGEIIHGDYNQWACEDKLHSVTNYECYKGLYSSFNDRNFYEIAYSLNRQFGKCGIYQNKHHYNFLDNHDVDRIASKLLRHIDLFPLHILLYTIPGVPSIYYGSEWAITGKRTSSSDLALRPVFDLDLFKRQTEFGDLSQLIQRLNMIRKGHLSLSQGDYTQIYLDHSQLIFKRESDKEKIYIGINASDQEFVYHFEDCDTGQMDILNDRKPEFTNGKLSMRLYPNWGSIIIHNK